MGSDDEPAVYIHTVLTAAHAHAHIYIWILEFKVEKLTNIMIFKKKLIKHVV